MADDVLSMAAAYVERMAADHEGAAVHLLASPNRVPVALDEARVREGVATNLWSLAAWLREHAASTGEGNRCPTCGIIPAKYTTNKENNNG